MIKLSLGSGLTFTDPKILCRLRLVQIVGFIFNLLLSNEDFIVLFNRIKLEKHMFRVNIEALVWIYKNCL